jgi:hypothetical protein
MASRGIAFLMLFCAPALALAAPEAPLRYYVEVRGSLDPSGKPTPFTEALRERFVDKLRRRGDVALTAPAWLPHDPAAMSLELARRGVRAYEAYVKLLSLTENVGPAPHDPSRRLVSIEIAIGLHGSSIPNQILKIGGEGRASAELVIGAGVDPATVRARLLHDASEAALNEAIAATEQKIALIVARERDPMSSHAVSALSPQRREPAARRADPR